MLVHPKPADGWWMESLVKTNVTKECLVLDIVSVKRDDGEIVSSFMLFLSRDVMVRLSHSLCGFCPKR